MSKVLAEAGYTSSLDVLPWARAYAIATSQANTLIFSIARTPQREEQFYWIGTLMDLQYYFYGLSKNFAQTPQQLNDYKNLRVGAILDSATHQYLTQQGFDTLYCSI